MVDGVEFNILSNACMKMMPNSDETLLRHLGGLNPHPIGMIQKVVKLSCGTPGQSFDVRA